MSTVWKYETASKVPCLSEKAGKDAEVTVCCYSREKWLQYALGTANDNFNLIRTHVCICMKVPMRGKKQISQLQRDTSVFKGVLGMGVGAA